MFAWSAFLTRSCALLLSLGILIGPSPLAAADSHFRVDHVPYTIGFPLPFEGGCDEANVGSVRFCDALSEGHGWDKFTLAVRDGTGLPAGGYYEFRGADGSALVSGTFCRDVRHPVPLEARELYVEPGVLEGECVNPGTAGHVVVAWRVSREPSPAVPDDEECDT